MTVLPYKTSQENKKKQVATMFNNIAGNYDFLNHFLSLGIDIYWRKKAIKLLIKSSPQFILDVATGTADFAIEALKLNPQKIVGVDISEGMLHVGKEKIKKKGLQNKIELKLGDSENLPFESNTFDAVIVSFGVRNFENLEEGLKNIKKVLKPTGKLVVLEFSKPKTFPFKQLYNFYFDNILPLLGKVISKDQSAYHYLPESVRSFPDGDQFLSILNKLEYKKATCTTLTFGISSIYFAEK